METTRFTAPDIECDGCANAIKRALATVHGVSAVDVDVPTKAVAVQHESDVDRETLESALDRAGFPVTA